MEYPDDIFIKQIRFWIDSFDNSNEKFTQASDVIQTVKIIEECYKNKKSLIRW